MIEDGKIIELAKSSYEFGYMQCLKDIVQDKTILNYLQSGLLNSNNLNEIIEKKSKSYIYDCVLALF